MNTDAERAQRVEVAIGLGLAGFTLDAEWTAGPGVTVLYGPSGAGKTLTLRCLAGLVRPERGRIVIDGRVVFDAAAGVDVPPAERRVTLGRALTPEPAWLLLLDDPLSGLDRPTREGRWDALRSALTGRRSPTIVATHDFTEAYRLADRIVVYREGRAIQSAPRAELLWGPGAESVARLMGVRNICHGVVLKAATDRIQLRWRGQTLEAVNSPSRPYLPAAGSTIAFFIRPEYVRLIRKDRTAPDPHHMNLMSGTVVSQRDFGPTWTLAIRLDEPGAPAQGAFDLEVEVPRLVHEMLELDRDRHWQVSIHRGSIQVLPA